MTRKSDQSPGADDCMRNLYVSWETGDDDCPYSTPLALPRARTVRSLTPGDRAVLREDIKRIENVLPHLSGAERLDALATIKTTKERLGFVDFKSDDERGSVLRRGQGTIQAL